MNVIFLLIAVSLLVAIGFLLTFIWTIKSGQYEDDYTPSVRILFDDEVNVLPDSSDQTAGHEKSAAGENENNKPNT